MIKLNNVSYQPGVGSGNVITGAIEFQASIDVLEKVLAPAILQEIVKRLGCKTVAELKNKMDAWNSVDNPPTVAIRKDQKLMNESVIEEDI